jgi:hypothetical protein
VVVTVLCGVLATDEDWHGRHTSTCWPEPVDHAAVARPCGAEGDALSVRRTTCGLRGYAADAPCVIGIITDPQTHPPLTALNSRVSVLRDRTRAHTRAPAVPEARFALGIFGKLSAIMKRLV